MTDNPSTMPLPPRYKDLPAAPRVYEAICKTLSERGDQVAWHDFSPEAWNLLSGMAKQEGVAALLYWQFKDGNRPEGPPERVYAALKSEYYNTLANNSVLFEELERVLEALEHAGVPVILLKEAALAGTVYENIGLRPMGDLDLLVKVERFSEAYAAIEGLGYREYGYELRPGFDRVYRHNVPLRKNKVVLELHWTLISGRVDIRSPSKDWGWEGVQTRACPALKGRMVNLLNPEDQTLYVSAHAALQHGAAQSPLLWFYDVSLLLRTLQKEVGWDDNLMADAGDLGWQEALTSAARRAKACFGVGLPACIENGPRYDEFYRARRIFFIKGFHQVPYAFAILVPGRARMQQLYSPKPAWLWPVYYVRHWYKLLPELLFAG